MSVYDSVYTPLLDYYWIFVFQTFHIFLVQKGNDSIFCIGHILGLGLSNSCVCSSLNHEAIIKLMRWTRYISYFLVLSDSHALPPDA